MSKVDLLPLKELLKELPYGNSETRKHQHNLKLSALLVAY